MLNNKEFDKLLNEGISDPGPGGSGRTPERKKLISLGNNRAIDNHGNLYSINDDGYYSRIDDDSEFDSYTMKETAEFIDLLIESGKSFEEAIDFAAKSAKTYGKPQYTARVIRQIYKALN